MCKRKPSARYAYFARRAKETKLRAQCRFPAHILRAVSVSFPDPIVNKLLEKKKAETSRKQKKPKTSYKRHKKKSQNPHLRNTFCIVSSGVLLFSPFVRFVCRVVDCSCC